MSVLSRPQVRKSLKAAALAVAFGLTVPATADAAFIRRGKLKQKQTLGYRAVTTVTTTPDEQPVDSVHMSFSVGSSAGFGASASAGFGASATAGASAGFGASASAGTSASEEQAAEPSAEASAELASAGEADAPAADASAPGNPVEEAEDELNAVISEAEDAANEAIAPSVSINDATAWIAKEVTTFIGKGQLPDASDEAVLETTSTDADGDKVTMKYAWYVNGKLVSSATSLDSKGAKHDFTVEVKDGKTLIKDATTREVFVLGNNNDGATYKVKRRFRPRDRGYKSKSGVLTVNIYSSNGGGDRIAPPTNTTTTTTFVSDLEVFCDGGCEDADGNDTTGERLTGKPILFESTAYLADGTVAATHTTTVGIDDTPYALERTRIKTTRRGHVVVKGVVHATPHFIDDWQGETAYLKVRGTIKDNAGNVIIDDAEAEWLGVERQFASVLSRSDDAPALPDAMGVRVTKRNRFGEHLGASDYEVVVEGLDVADAAPAGDDTTVVRIAEQADGSHRVLVATTDEDVASVEVQFLTAAVDEFQIPEKVVMDKDTDFYGLVQITGPGAASDIAEDATLEYNFTIEDGDTIHVYEVGGCEFRTAGNGKGTRKAVIMTAQNNLELL